MGAIIVNNKTGEVIGDKIYTTKGRAEGVIKKATVDEKIDWVAILMPSEHVLKIVANGGEHATFATVKYCGEYQLPPIDFDD